MKSRIAVAALALCFIVTAISNAQVHAGAFVGFKSFGLKGAGTSTTSAGTSTVPSSDAGGTVFDFGAFGGYTPFGVGVYHLDVQLVASYTSIGFFERGYNSAPGAGSGKFAADGYSGGSTSLFEFDVLGLNRLTLPAVNFVEPYAGLGLSFGIYSTGDLNFGPPGNSTSGTVKGTGQFKLGLLFAYGAILHVTPVISPFIQLQHLVPFGSQFQFTDDPNGSIIIKDVPGYFSLNAGVRMAL